MDNNAIADQFSLLAKLMDIHGENSFKAKSYATAAYTIEKLTQPLANLPQEKIQNIKGIGESVGKKVMELLTTGELSLLQEYLQQTPEGVLEMMNIKGLGPKKIHTLWKELHIDSIEQLRQACETNQIAEKKGFGEKTQQNILASIEFQQQNTGKYLYAHIEDFATLFTSKLQEAFPNDLLQITGQFRRQLEIIDQLEWVTTLSKTSLQKYAAHQELEWIQESEDELVYSAKDLLHLHFHLTTKKDFSTKLFATSSSEAFLTAWNETQATLSGTSYDSEAAIFEKAHIP